MKEFIPPFWNRSAKIAKTWWKWKRKWLVFSAVPKLIFLIALLSSDFLSLDSFREILGGNLFCDGKSLDKKKLLLVIFPFLLLLTH